MRQEPSVKPKKRPFSATSLALGVLIIAVLHLVRLQEATQRWQFLQNLSDVSPLYLSMTGAIWGFIGFLLFLGLWFGIPWAWRLTFLAAPAYFLYYWIERLIAIMQSGLGANLPFSVFLSATSLITIWLILTRKSVKAYFGVYDEQRR